MGDSAVTSFLGCCVSLLQVLMEVTERLNLIGSPLSFLRPSVSTDSPPLRPSCQLAVRWLPAWRAHWFPPGLVLL